jgi:thiol-disulfide isomerase/thioredoxin
MNNTVGRYVLIALMGLFAIQSQAQDQLPSVDLMNIEGQKVDVSQYGDNGKITIINFWATWCTPCKKELNTIADLYPDWQEDYNAELIAISIDDARNKAKVKTYVNGQGWDYDVLLDQNQVLKQRLNFQTIPFTVIIDQDGNIVEKHTGYVDGDEYILEEELEHLAQ